MGKSMTSVLIVDDHPVVLQGCRRILEDAGITAILEASDTTTAYDLFRDHRPDVAVIDLSMRNDDLRGLSLIRRSQGTRSTLSHGCPQHAPRSHSSSSGA